MGNHRLNIVLSRTSTRIGSVIRTIMGGNFNHCSFFCDDETDHVYGFSRKYRELWYTGCFTLENPLYFEEYEVFEIPLSDVQYGQLADRINDMNTNVHMYNYVAAMLIPANIPVASDGSFICSTFVADLIDKHTDIALDKNVHLYRPMDIHDLMRACCGRGLASRIDVLLPVKEEIPLDFNELFRSWESSVKTVTGRNLNNAVGEYEKWLHNTMELMGDKVFGMKKLTILHSNDMHGDFMEEEENDVLVGGVSMLSGYIKQVRQEEKNVIYAIAGDMFRGSVIDSEYQGISTIQIMNMLGPDVVTLGNHEVDYGVAHLLFLEKCADFPIVNANLYIKTNNKRLFEPCHMIEIDGMKVLFIGILTETTLAQCKSDGLIGSLITLEDAVREIGKICNAHNAIDIDFTVLLTHIGFEEDKKLAAMLDPAWGVDVIIGGHSHTFLEAPCEVNGIPIVQAGTGTDQIGRFDIMVDTRHNRIDSYTWQTVPIDEGHCPRDPEIENVIHSYKTHTDAKYGKIITRLHRPLTHPERNQETEIGNLFSDIFKEALGVDIFLCGSGSIRTEYLRQVVTVGDLRECFPYDNAVHLVFMTGAQLKHAIAYMLRDEALDGSHTEFYQFSDGLCVEYDRESKCFSRFDFEGAPVEDGREYTVGMEHFHYMNLPASFDLKPEDVCSNHRDRIISTSCLQILEEVLGEGRHRDARVCGRLVIR